MKKIPFRFIFCIALFCAIICNVVFTGSRVYAQMLDRTATRVQSTLHISWKQLGSITPKSVGEVDSSPWSLGCEVLDRDYIYYDTYKEYIVPLGIKKIRLQGGWAKTEKEKGIHNFQWLDDIINDALSKGLEIWLETGYGNPIYEGGGGFDLGAGFPVSDEGLAAWDKWVEAMASRYKGKVRDWAMWNEPDLKGRTAEQIADFNIRTAEIIKRVIPDARIGALSLAGNNPKLVEGCLNRFVEKGKLDLFEWVIYHGYSPNPDKSYTKVEEQREVINRFTPKLKLWQGENGCPSEMAHRFAMSNIPWSELTQSKWDSRRMLGDRGHDVISAVFTICDFDHTGREINRKGLLKINNKTSLAKVKSAYYTVQNVVSVFDGTLVRQKDYPCTIDAPPEKNVIRFAYKNPAGQDYLVFWDGSNMPKDDNTTFPVSITVENGGFKDPVWCDIITGRIYEIPSDSKNISEGKTVLTKIPAYDAPVLIVDRSVVLKAAKPAAPVKQ